MMLLVNNRTGDAINATSAAMFRSLVLDGWEPVGPNGKAAAEKLRAGFEWTATGWSRPEKPVTEAMRERAYRFVRDAEIDLHHKLTEGQRRDLLCDNTPWSREQIVEIVGRMGA